MKDGIRRSTQAAIPVIHRLLDQVMVFGSLQISTLIWDKTWSIYSVVLALAFGTLLTLFAELGALYTSWRGVLLWKHIRATNIALGLSMAAVVVLLPVLSPVLKKDFKLLWTWFALLIVGANGLRIFVRIFLTQMRSQGYNLRVCAIAGAGSLGLRLKKNIQSAPWMGLQIGGFYDDHKTSDRVIGDLEQLVADAKAGKYDRVYLTLPMRAEKRMIWLVQELADTTATVYIVPDIFVFELLHAKSENLNGLPTISIFDSPIEGVNAWIKRTEDIVVSSVILAMISPLMVVLALLVKLTSKGPVFFKQNRYGMGGEQIRVWKFRSMTVMEQGGDVVQAKANDPRITPLGAFLRRTSLDELPQFINVLKGDMSIVGPRPHATAHNEHYRKLIDRYMLRHKVKPGITGWAQINGWRGETDTLYKMAKRIKFDLYYIQNWNLWFDLKIIFLTVFKGFVGKNAR